ncbi:MAG: LysM peptidoglycan-binding domain-containing protein [Hyphomicrobium sp.]|nr:LysM peptidoglycan-binding domain-containing protein [Hyphomicrobium sp.]
MPTDAAPPTIDKVIFEPGGAAYIEGEGRPGDVVELISDDVALGVATVAQSGQWRIALRPGLKAGTFWMRAVARAGAAGRRAAGDEIRVAIPSELRRRAVVQHDGPFNETEQATRLRAEELAEGAGQAFDDITQRQTPTDQVTASTAAAVGAPNTENDQTVREGALGVVIAWLKRSAKSYREEVVQKLRVSKSDTAAPDLRQDKDLPEEKSQNAVIDPEPIVPPADAQSAVKVIAKERAEAEARRTERAEADRVRRAEEAEKAAAEAAQKEALKRRQADELARKKAEADKRIAEELERLKLAREEADRAKARKDAELPIKAPQKVTITLERFFLPGEKPPDTDKTSASDARAIAAAKAHSNSLSGPCEHGRVVHRRGRRWYVTGADDTLWDIAERFYGSGLAYPRIYQVNRKRLSSPHVVRPCLALQLPGRR